MILKRKSCTSEASVSYFFCSEERVGLSQELDARGCGEEAVQRGDNDPD